MKARLALFVAVLSSLALVGSATAGTHATPSVVCACDGGGGDGYAACGPSTLGYFASVNGVFSVCAYTWNGYGYVAY